MNEWEFTALAAGWINEVLARESRLPFRQARCEQSGTGSRKRRDLTLLGEDGRPVLTGEVKLPYNPDGFSAFNSTAVEDARKKAQRVGVGHFFTWNVNDFVLWETFPPERPASERYYRLWHVTQVVREDQLTLPVTEHAIRKWLGEFLREYANITAGLAALGRLPPDERFIEQLEADLRAPIDLTLKELIARYTKPNERAQLDRWMREEQGWVISNGAEAVQANLERAAKFACYALVNKLVFYEALLKRFAPGMLKLSIPRHVGTGESLRLHIWKHFEEAKVATRDYETVFGEEHVGLGDRIPVYSDHAVPYWRELIERIHEFDFSKLDYDVIGRIFERLIAPEERHKYGQFYTRPEVVDLINSFAIRRADAVVMDPACGGGTFLVRAYARKRELDRTRPHRELLREIFGIDISKFAAHLSTINLATRDLVEADNYPQVARSDFFDVRPQKPYLSLPGLSGHEHRQVAVPPLDAVVGNPPYVRQEDIPRAGKRKKRGDDSGTKEHYERVVTESWPKLRLSGRSDLHCYFWPHAAAFLKEDGCLCLLTSSQWLDVDYGFRLQEWMLENFRILAVFESVDEPWFVGARVATAVTILQRERSDEKRRTNPVRFVQLRRPMREVLAHDGTAIGAMEAADSLRDEILGLEANAVNERYRARLVTQGRLWTAAVELGQALGVGNGYYGSKWGVYLRAPDVWFQLIDLAGDRLVPLGTIADVRFGVKTGKDCFFFPRDVSKQALAKHRSDMEFHTAYGVRRSEVRSGRVKLVRCGEGYGEIRPIEAEYLEPEVHSLMEVKGFRVAAKDCSRLILLVDKPKEALKGTYVLEYIKWGEEQEYHTGATCAARVGESRPWYDLTGHVRAPMLWAKERQYRHVAPCNDHRLAANCRLYEVSPRRLTRDRSMWAGVLNSTVVALSCFQFGRPVGNEGAWSTMVDDVGMMLVPDPRRATAAQRKRVAAAFRKMLKRKPLAFLSERRLRRMSYTERGKEDKLAELPDVCELDMPDRRELDDAVLQMMGISEKDLRSKLLDQLYGHMRDFFEQVRQKEEKAIANKRVAKRGGRLRPDDIAAQILADIQQNEPELLRSYDPHFVRRDRPYDTYELPEGGAAEPHNDMFTKNGVRFVKGRKTVKMLQGRSRAQADLLHAVAASGVRGLVCVPLEEDECRRVQGEYESFLGSREARLWELIEQRTGDPDLQDRIHDALMRLVSSPR